MKPEEQRKALEEFDGWARTWLHIDHGHWRSHTYHPTLEVLPNYLSDRDAIVRLVKKLDPKQAARFIYHVEQELSRIRFPDLPAEMKEGEPEDWIVENLTVPFDKAFLIATADPAVWAKAALKTLNLWTCD